MKGQQLTRTKQLTRTQKRQQEKTYTRRQVAWHGAGLISAACLMTYFDLWNPMAVLAALGGAEAVAKVWRAIWDWLGA